MRDLVLSALEARAVHDTLAYLVHPQRVRDDPDTAPLLAALAKIQRYADEAFCSEKDCDRPTYAKGRCEPCYRTSLRRDKRRDKASEVA